MGPRRLREALRRLSPLALAAVLAAACRPPAAVLLPAGEIASLEGYAGLKLERGGAVSRARLSFVLQPPERGRVEISDPLDRTIALILVAGPDAYLVLPSRRTYWRGPAEEAVGRLLGFPVSVAEMAGLLSGRGDPGPGWAVDRDAAGRPAAARRGGLEVTFEAFFSRSPVPRRISFVSAQAAGTFALSGLAFNRPPSGRAFETGFLAAFVEATWEEIERLLGRGDED